MRRSLQNIDFIDYKISELSEMAKINHDLLEKKNSFFATISDATIREYYSEYGETMIDLDLNYFRDKVLGNLKSIIKMKGTPYFSSSLKPGQIKQLDESEKLAKDSLKILDNIENIIKNIIEKRLNNAIMGTLQDLAREKVREHNIPPEDYRQRAVLDESYGGFRNRKNKTNNKKYAKKTTYKRPKKRVSNKNKTRKMKKNYL
jgi:hypothetical protein